MSPRVRPVVLRVARALAIAAGLGFPGPAGIRVGGRIAVAAAVTTDAEESPRSRSAAPAPVIVANGVCPPSETIWSAMAGLVPRGALDALPRSAAVEVSDLGETYRVRLAINGVERVRIYRDVARDCQQRARFAAVFIVLTLMPPELLLDTPPKLPPPEPAAVVVAAAPPPSVTTTRPRFWQLELAALGDTAPAVLSGPDMTSAGGELRAALGSGRFAALIGVGLNPRTNFTLGGLRAREQRVAIDLGVRGRHRLRWLELGGEAGLVAALFRAEGLSPVVARQATRIDGGVRVGVTLRFGPPDARLAPIIGVHGSYFPRPYEIAMVPAGVVGRTPTFRVGASLGVAATF